MNFRVKTIAPFPSQVSGSCMSFQKCTCLLKHVIVFAFNKIGNKLITFRQMSICKFRFHYFRVSQTMIELKDCAADAACAVPGESHCLGHCSLVSAIDSLTLLGGGLKPCAVNAIWFKYNKNAFSKQYFIRYGYLKLTVRGQI